MKTSFVLITYNRAPEKMLSKNPLYWALKTILNNSLLPDEIIIIDDDSNDYTKPVVRLLSENYRALRYIKMPKHVGMVKSRNIGLRIANNKLVFMGDDDCLYKEDFIKGAIETYEFINKGNSKVAVINFPVYERKLKPTRQCLINNIGRIYPEKAFFKHNFDAYPKEYLYQRAIIPNTKLLKPFKVDTFSGVNLVYKDKIMEVGGFLESKELFNLYSEHLELSHALKKNGYEMYHQPDPSTGAIHLKYGALSTDRIIKSQGNTIFKGLDYNFSEILRLSNQKIINTGTRCSNKEFHQNEIASILAFFWKIDPVYGGKFANREFHNFVIKGKIFSTTPQKVITAQSERCKIWESAIKLGLKLANENPARYKTIINEVKKSKKRKK